MLPGVIWNLLASSPGVWCGLSPVREGEEDLRVAERHAVARCDLAHRPLVLPGDLDDPFGHGFEDRVGRGMARPGHA